LFANWPIRIKLLIGLGLLLMIVAGLAGSGLYTTYAYRSLVKSISARSVELPTAAALNARIWEMRSVLAEVRGLRANFTAPLLSNVEPVRVQLVRAQFVTKLDEVEHLLGTYQQLLAHKLEDDLSISENSAECQTLRRLQSALRGVREANRDQDWMFYDRKFDQLGAALDELQTLATDLPSHLHHKLSGFADEARSQYRAQILGTWITVGMAGISFALFLRLFYRWIFSPLGTLISGSREVAAGHFHYRIHLPNEDEMGELADAMNQMTARFQAIRDDLDRQVQERTKQVIRNEELASVGFLAAGVAHEINNPLATIAMCAESLEVRTRDLLDAADPEHQVIGSYLTMIQNEAFRCKEITEKLLDFSRIGEVRRQETDLRGLVSDVIDMVRHLGKYQHKHIELAAGPPLAAAVNAREIKQVALNLLTNALDCTAEDGHVRVTLAACHGMAELTVSDDGCGMEPDVLDRVFEPFFTRRKAGQGTGLGLSITHRIVADHGGEITAASPGPGQGSTFRVRLPLDSQKENRYQHQAA
jgi:two-component system, NtrC family, sensor kinase